MGEQEAPGETEEAKTATGAVNSPWPGRRSLGSPHLHLRRHHGWQIEQDFKDIKEVHGAGQQQVRHYWANVAAYHLCLWLYTLVELWAWQLPGGQLCDRRRSPWDDPTRRPSHADRRNALRRRCLEEELRAAQRRRPLTRKSRGFVRRLLGLVT